MVKNAGNADVSEAVDAVYKLSEEQRLRYLSVIEHMHDMDEAIKETQQKEALEEQRKKALAEGHAEGLAEGRAKGRAELSKEIETKLRQLNLSQEQIDSVLRDTSS